MRFEINKASWFPTDIFYTKIDESFCNKIEEKVLLDKEKWNENLENVHALTTGFNGLDQYTELHELSNFICNKVLNEIGKTQDWKFNNWSIREAWINFYRKGDFTKIHTHGSADFCGILIVCPGKGNLKFSSTEAIEQKTKKFMKIYDEKINEEKGTLILFPSHLYHGVENCEKNRITIAMNFKNNEF